MIYDKKRHLWLVGSIKVTRIDASRFKVTSSTPSETAYASTIEQAQKLAEMWQLRGRS